jgi:hypothetical protein
MHEEQQGLYMLTSVCSIVGLLASLFVLLTCFGTGMYKVSSIRLVMYLAVCNIIGELDLLLPTYQYSFMCAFQGHVLNFALFSQLFWGCLMGHYGYLKAVHGTSFTKVQEVRYLGLAVIPAFIASLPMFVSEKVGQDCWTNDQSPLLDVVSSYGFLLIYTIGFLVNFSFALGMYSHLDLFPVGYYPKEFEKKVEKIKQVGRYTVMIYGTGMVVFVYAIMEMVNRKPRAMDFLAMFAYSVGGVAVMILFLATPKVKREMAAFFKEKGTVVDLMPEDKDNFTSFTESMQVSRLSD